MKIDVNGPEDASTNVLYFQDNGDQIVTCSSATTLKVIDVHNSGH